MSENRPAASADQRGTLIRLVTRLIVAQAAVAAAIGLFGVLRFMTARYVGGTLLAVITAAVLLDPAVARAYGSAPQPGQDGLAKEVLSETAPG